MTRRSDVGRGAPPEREDVQRALARWATLPTAVAPKDAVAARHARGLVTLRAAIGSAKRERQMRRMRLSLGAAAAVALLGWAGMHFSPGQLRTAAGTAQVTGPAGGHGPAATAGPNSATSGGTEARSQARPAPREHDPRPFFVEGSYEVFRSGVWSRGALGGEIAVGDEVHALEEPIEVSLDRITSAYVTGRSALAIAALDPHRQELRLLRGSADFRVDPKRSADVVVYAGSARIHVTGTAFSVTVGQGQKAVWSEVMVKVGHVEVLAQDRHFVLEAGDSWSSRDGTVRHALTKPQGMATSSTSAIDSRGADGSHGATAPSGAGMSASGRPAGGSLAGMDDSTTTLSEENRLFRAALSARNAGSHGRCVGLLSELITKFPSSPLRQEAIVAQFRCQSSGGQFAAAHRTALRYLSEYPSGFARDEARSLVVDAAQ